MDNIESNKNPLKALQAMSTKPRLHAKQTDAEKLTHALRTLGKTLKGVDFYGNSLYSSIICKDGSILELKQILTT